MAIGISYVRSGGQTGADRAALDVARELGYEIAGWCPAGGWAEDLTTPPGLLEFYPEMTETPHPDTHERTVWNVRDSDGTLILYPSSYSMGTNLTEMIATEYNKPYLTLHDLDYVDLSNAIKWVEELPGFEIVLNVAGPRESECPGLYDDAVAFLRQLLAEFSTR